MSNAYQPTSPYPASLKRLTDRYDDTGNQMVDFLNRQAHGENPDPDEFMKLLHKRSVTADAMQAQYAIHKKPLKTALNEAK